MTATGFLHPGAMGASIAANCGGSRFWCSDGRSAATRARAEAAGLVATTSLVELAERCDTIVSICPPAAAVTVAEQIAATGFDGLYLDANAVAPATSARIGASFTRYVDGGIIGPPVTTSGTTRLYLSGDESQAVSERWAGSLLDVRAIDGGVGAASAVKMLFAGWGKHNAALMFAINAAAEAYGVTDAIRAEWNISRPEFISQSEAAGHGTAPKAWRFEGEMHEIAATFEAAGLPPEFHLGAAEVFRRLARFKDGASSTDLDEIVGALLGR